MPVIDRHAEVIDSIERLVAGCRALKVPMLITEQYSKGLGHTVEPIQTAMGEWYRPIEKMSFSAAAEYRFMGDLETIGRQTVLLCGVESHVCVYQTARDLRNLGFDVEIVVDAVGSRSPVNHRLALDKMMRHNIEATSVEMALKRERSKSSPFCGGPASTPRA